MKKLKADEATGADKLEIRYGDPDVCDGLCHRADKGVARAA